MVMVTFVVLPANMASENLALTCFLLKVGHQRLLLDNHCNNFFYLKQQTNYCQRLILIANTMKINNQKENMNCTNKRCCQTLLKSFNRNIRHSLSQSVSLSVSLSLTHTHTHTHMNKALDSRRVASRS